MRQIIEKFINPLGQDYKGEGNERGEGTPTDNMDDQQYGEAGVYMKDRVGKSRSLTDAEDCIMIILWERHERQAARAQKVDFIHKNSFLHYIS